LLYRKLLLKSRGRRTAKCTCSSSIPLPVLTRSIETAGLEFLSANIWSSMLMMALRRSGVSARVIREVCGDFRKRVLEITACSIVKAVCSNSMRTKCLSNTRLTVNSRADNGHSKRSVMTRRSGSTLSIARHIFHRTYYAQRTGTLQLAVLPLALTGGAGVGHWLR